MTPPGFPALAPLQTLFWRLIAAPEGVARGAQALRRERVLDSSDLDFLVRPDARMNAVERLDVYADMYFYRLRDCLAEDFPRVAAWLSDARFHDLVTDYLLAHPPSHFSLRELGRALPDFLASHPQGGELPAVADLARLEWARVDVFDEADAVPLARDVLLARATAAPDGFRFERVPATRLLRLDASALPRWKALGGDAGDAVASAVAASAGQGAALVWRQGFAVFHRSLAADEAVCLEALGEAPLTLARVGELLHAAQPAGCSDAAVAGRLAALLERWSADEILRAARS
ncbi:MAG: DNA-binding domain-containing protein [Myxococcota bacterium]|nr:DNA-binding domain-containing protein [Myxococcota bacterium]